MHLYITGIPKGKILKEKMIANHNCQGLSGIVRILEVRKKIA
jgi:hypothetical protein